MIIKHNTIKNILLFLVSLFISLVLGELVLRFVINIQPAYYLFPPEFHTSFTPDLSIIPGVSDTANFSTNTIGLRSDEIPANTSNIVLAIGGSTTECIYLDQQDAWPQQLQKRLRQNTHEAYWVGNAGISGNQSYDYIEMMNGLLNQPSLRNTKLILVMTGINDCICALSNIIYEEKQKTELPFYKRNSYYTLWSNYWKKRNNSYYCKLDQKGEVIKKWRIKRAIAKIWIDTIPNINPILKKYRQNIETMINIAHLHNTRIIFIPQPVLFNDNMDSITALRLWTCGAGNYLNENIEAYYTPHAMKNAIDLFNNTLIDVCNTSHTEYINLSQSLPTNTTMFFDDCHFTVKGSNEVAKQISNYLLKNRQ